MNQEKSSLNNNYRQKIDERAELFDGHEKTVYKCGYKDGFIDCEEYTAPLREELEKLRAELTTLKVDTTYDITNLTIEKEQLKAKNERLKNSFDEVFNQRNSIQSKNERLEDENGELMKLYMDALGHRAKLREALEKCKTILSCWNDTESINKVIEIAKEALKEDNIDTCKKCGYPLFKMHHENKIRCHGCDNIIELKGNE